MSRMLTPEFYPSKLLQEPVRVMIQETIFFFSILHYTSLIGPLFCYYLISTSWLTLFIRDSNTVSFKIPLENCE